MKKPFTAEMYFQLIELMFDAGLENVDDCYRTSLGKPDREYRSIRDYSDLDFTTNFNRNDCMYQYLIEQAKTNEWGDGVTLNRAQTVEVLRNIEGDRFNAIGLTVMCKEYGHMDDSDEPNEDGSMDCDMWSGLDPDDIDTILEFPDEYKTFVLTTHGLELFDTPTHFEVEIRIGTDYFENIWTQTDESGVETPTTFETWEAAQAAIDEFLDDQADSFALGDMDELYNPDDYIITEQEST